MTGRNRSRKYLRLYTSEPPAKPPTPTYSRTRIFVGNEYEVFTSSGAWWFWRCQQGELPTSGSFGPFESAAVAARAATEFAVMEADGPAPTVICGGKR